MNDPMTVPVDAAGAALRADLTIPDDARGLVLFAHGSGSSRQSPRNRAVAQRLNEAGLATLLTDLLTPAEELADERTAHLRFDISLLSGRLVGVVDWLVAQPATSGLPLGLFGASTGAAAALATAARRPDGVQAVVSRGGRPDLAGAALRQVKAPTLLIVGGEDHTVLKLNRRAAELMTTEVALYIVPGATHLFPEPGALEEVADAAATWFTRHH